MVDPIPVNMAEAKAEGASLVAHNTGWLRTNWRVFAYIGVGIVIAILARAVL